MKKSSDIITSLFIIVLGIALFIIKGSIVNLFFGIIGVGMLLSVFEEKIISKILMIVGGLGSLIFGIRTIVLAFMHLI